MSGELPENKSPPAGGERMTTSEAYEGVTERAALLDRIKNNYMEDVGAAEENRRLHTEDLNFVYNSETQGQWDPVVLEARKGKPCYTFNRVIGPVNLVIADMRQTRPAIKVRPSTEEATEAVADVFGGLFRSMEQMSRAQNIYKTQYKFAVAGGYGAWRLMPEYADDDSFDQVLKLKDIANPQTVIWDHLCVDPCAGDARRCIVAENISKTQFEEEYPGFQTSSINMSRDSYGWFTDKDVRVAEYYEKVPFIKEIALLDDGSVVDYDEKEKEVQKHLEETGVKYAKVVKTRSVTHWRIMWCKASGAEILEGPEFYDWKRIPVVRVPGRYINIEGRKKLQSLIRHSKDAQRSYNSRGSDMIERSALTPKAPYLVTETMIKGYEAEWAQSNTASRPYLPYNVDPKAVESGGMPTRTPPIDVPSAALALSQQALSDIQATTGFFDPAMGNADDMNRVSGKALVQHTRRSDLSSFEFIDGFGDALQLTAEMFIDMVPTIMDSERVVRIIGVDGTEKMVKLYDSSGDVMIDLKKGAYDVTATLGPSYQTARQEAMQTILDAMDVLPNAAPMLADLLVKNLDTPEAGEMARRLRIALIQQGIVQPTEEEKKQLPPPPQPSPVEQAEAVSKIAGARSKVANAAIAESKAKVSNIEVAKLIKELAGNHLDNLLKAQKLGENERESASEAEADAAAAK
jgi:hypothetical protein